jgi:hypothetical protein
MQTGPMTQAVPTTAQAERIHHLIDQAVAEHPRQAELLRGIEQIVVQQPDDSGPGFPEPLETLVEQVLAGVLEQGPTTQENMLKIIRDGQQ